MTGNEPAIPFGLSRETTIRRDVDGRWTHDGIPLARPSLERAFDGWLTRADDGRFCLKNEINWAYVHVDGPRYFVRHAALEHERVRLALSDGTTAELDPETLRADSHGYLYCSVGREVARFDHAAVGVLAEVMSEGAAGETLLKLGDACYTVPVVDAPMTWVKAGS